MKPLNSRRRHRRMSRGFALITLITLLSSAFSGEPPVYYDTVQKAAEAFTNWPAAFEFTAADAQLHISAFRPSRIEQSTVVMSDSKSAIIFAKAEPVVVHGGSVRSVPSTRALA